MKRCLLSLFVVATLLLAEACSTNRIPRFDTSSGEPQQFRRYTGRPMVDYTFRWTRKAFDKVESDLTETILSEDARDVLDRHGRPDYVRLDVKATRNEIFDEWAYLDHNVLVQFVAGQLVYEGPMIDSDRYLITWGYPTRAYSQQYETGPLREIWYYEHLFEVGGQWASFTNGELVAQAQF